MIKVEIEGGHMKCQAHGDAVRLASEAALIVSARYENYARAGRRAEAAVFRAAVTAALTAPGSPVWELGNSEGTSGVFVCVPDMRGRKGGEHAES